MEKYTNQDVIYFVKKRIFAISSSNVIMCLWCAYLLYSAISAGWPSLRMARKPTAWFPPGGYYIFWVRGRAIGKGIDFHEFGIRNGIDFHDFVIRNGIDFSIFAIGIGYAFSENWYKVGYIF